MTKNTCGARNRAGNPCRQPAGWGTDHVGSGRCKLHGGASLRGIEHPNFVDGAHSKHFEPSDVVGFDEWRSRLGPALDFRDEVLFRVFLASQMTVDDEGRLQPVQVMTRRGPVEFKPDPKYLLECADLASRVFERLRQAMDGATVNVRLADPQVQALMEALGDALAECVSDPAEARAVLDFIEARMKSAQGAS